MTVLLAAYLERHAALDLFTNDLSDGLIEICQDLHRKLRLHTPAADEVVKSVCQCDSDTK